MIGSLRGTVLDRDPDNVVTLEVGGVGYRVTVLPRSTARTGDVAFCWVHTHVREDAITLFGFESLEERECFEMLLRAHGVGTSLALAVLAVHSPSSLYQAVAGEDVDALTLVPGIGRKTAARLLIDLRGRCGVPERSPASATVHGRSGEVRSDVREALSGLGYSGDEIAAAWEACGADQLIEEAGSSVDVDVVLRSALRSMAAGPAPPPGVGTTGRRGATSRAR